MKLQRRHPTLHPALHIPKLHQTTLEIFLGEIPLNVIIPGSLLELFPTIYLPLYFVHVFSCPSKGLSMASDGLAWYGAQKGKKRLVVTCFVMIFLGGFRTSPLPLELFLLRGNPT